MTNRNENIDLVRALAIALVLVHHIGQFQNTFPTIVLDYFKLGAYGVDLFFVLSGWLIGGLYWREHKEFGQVEIFRFWGRRWLRTLPPYFAVLPIAYLSVWLFRGEKFDLAYLIFWQNYHSEMPFFLVSWSLAVEEHFYLFLPLILFALIYSRISINAGLLVLITITTLMRLIDPNANPSSTFGYAYTATHLNMTGLLIGVYLAYLSQYKNDSFKRLCTFAMPMLLPALVVMLTIPLWSSDYRYYWGKVVISLIWSILLLALVNSPTVNIARSKAIKHLALWSYSVYLTHAMVINAGVLIADKLSIPRWSLTPVLILVILIVGGILFYLVEKPSLHYRNHLVPRRH